MSASNNSIATAIVIAGAMIAAAIYLGLRAAQPGPPPSPTPPAPEPAPAPRVRDRDEVTRDAIAALAYHRPDLVTRCYPPGERTPASFNFNVTFDAQGAQLAIGIEEVQGTSTPAISSCIADHLPIMTVPPPGRTTRVEIPLNLP